MRALWITILILSATAGCATTGGIPSNQHDTSSAFNAMASPSPLPDTSPRLMIPAGGGAPVMAIPLGGNIYLPLNADPVTVGIPLFP